MTATPAAPLDVLAQQIARQQAELEALRREYETRQTRLTDLSRRKEELTAQLQQVEADIHATTQGQPPRPASAKPAKPTAPRPQPHGRPPQPATPAAKPKPARPHTLPALLVAIVRQAAGPRTVAQLAQEVVRRQFPTTSGNVPRLVATRVKDLVKRGLLSPAPEHGGFVLAQPVAGAKMPAAKATPAPKASGKNGAVSAKAALPAKRHAQQHQLPLRVLLTNLLAKSRRPLAARALAEQVLAGGYQTKSTNFVEVVWAMLVKMDNVENVPGQGYLLKKP
jgi:hypothetical protein